MRERRAAVMGDIVFVPYSAHGHVNPMLPVVSALVARGKSVRVVVDRKFARVVAETGARPVVLPRDAVVHIPDGLHPRRGLAWIGRLVERRRLSAFLEAVLRGCHADLVVSDSHVPWADRVACSLQIPTAFFSTTYVTNEYVVRQRAGFPLPVGVIRRLHPGARRFHRHRGLVLANAVPQLQPALPTMPDKVSFVGPLSSLRGEHGADLPWDSIRRGPTLFVSPGTVFARRPDFFDAVTRVFRDTAWTVVFATGATDPTLLRPLPVNVIARRTVPQLELLAHTTVFLTHGGMNSALEALAAGVPMLLAPRSGEQKTVAKMLVELGVGVLLGTGDLRGLVEDLASNRGVRRSLERLVPTFADPAGVAADLLVGQVSSAAEQTEW